ncbi:MAG: hypothetical protein GX626_11570, partial [Spirochaetales bacterium]|nr:hypothetical protein [Spirochaetales bacterium]
MECGLDRVLGTRSTLHLNSKRLALVTNAASLTQTFESSKSFLCKQLNITA